MFNIFQEISSLQELQNNRMYYWNRMRPGDEREDEEEEDEDDDDSSTTTTMTLMFVSDDDDDEPVPCMAPAAQVASNWLPGDEEAIVNEMGEWYV